MQEMQRGGTATMTRFPVDNATYNLIKAAGEKLEAIEAYNKYAHDGGEGSDLWQRLAEEDARHAKELIDALHRQLMK
ncbi:MAG TPA: hypothetical protein VFK38_01940 [Candidatus Limnocylindrales bacterium]|nr:hypothetical protein [Candidatus Limnocylindrales bacterium]